MTDFLIPVISLGAVFLLWAIVGRTLKVDLPFLPKVNLSDPQEVNPPDPQKVNPPDRLAPWQRWSLGSVGSFLLLGGLLFMILPVIPHSDPGPVTSSTATPTPSPTQVIASPTPNDALANYETQINNILTPLQASAPNADHSPVPIRVRAANLTSQVLPQLDGTQKGLLLEFLYSNNLITYTHHDLPHWAPDSDISLAYMDFSDANLVNMDFSNGGVQFTYVNLNDADLQGTNLNSADLYGATLRGANLAGTDFTNVDLTNADLTNAQNTTYQQLHKAKSLQGAKLP